MGLLLGGAGGAETLRSPVNGGGTPNRLCDWLELSSIGVFGGRGGGGGPGVTFDVARGRRGTAGPAGSAYLPASAIGGGARNIRVGAGGGDGSRGGEETDSSAVSARPFRVGGGGGGPRRLAELVPVS